ncbi:DNA replication protein [Candidatus Regiella insecticola 5.15]|uniref:DNA replication protein n=1 Tax=Candidatus Regiella insecticola 5.15 TaxID=1005043 RepID=G2H1I5_9ENTR|nr:ATP-binding protein [Candidatus Regiella insecticola]EGY28143.1 DNA replication protein [Candidatus Regiella insecticola 5.15]
MQTVQQQLAGLKLSGVRAALTLQQQQPVHYQELSFEERLSLLLEQEISLRDKRKIERLTRQARLRLKAELANVDYSASRQLDKATIRSLTKGEWVKHHQNILITGATGCGKTWLACALGHHYCQQGMSVFYFRLKQLLAQMYLAQAEGSYRKLLDKLANCSLLLLDDWGLEPLNPQPYYHQEARSSPNTLII